MRELPFVTVFTPNYNKSKYLPETIESVLQQTYKNFEYIIVDDCSTDDSWDIIRTYASKDERIKPYRNEENLKIVKTRNKGFQFSSKEAKYYAILDSDDVSAPERLEKQVTFLEENPLYGLIGSDIIVINEESKEIGYRKYASSDLEIRKVITRLNPIAQSSVLIRKQAIQEVGYYDEQWNVCQDYDYWLRIGIDWKLKNFDNPLIKYRLSGTQVKITNLKETIQNTYLIQKKAIKEYNYGDSIYNKFYRLILRLSFSYPKFAYFIYRRKIRKQ
ncbi:MAG: glycosyltransferase [Candidatus Lokiarchaeota archaeon]|nr:glycosyltransferase [Candidatus Lokiarchaeota archaeon]